MGLGIWKVTIVLGARQHASHLIPLLFTGIWSHPPRSISPETANRRSKETNLYSFQVKRRLLKIYELLPAFE